jgi:hypothetical protein
VKKKQTRISAIDEIARVFIEAIRADVTADGLAALPVYINEAIKARRKGHEDRYLNQVEYIRSVLGKW